MQNLWTVSQYQVAYYGAISAVERAELGLRYRSPWFVWSWGFLWLTWYGPASDYTPTLLPWDNQWFVWSVDSRTTTIPHVGMGNTEPMLSDETSKDYNVLWYTNLETFLLSVDATTDPQQYYSPISSFAYFSGDSLTWVFRLPPKIHTLFWAVPGLLCDSSVGDCDPDEDGTYDDIAVSWSLEWLYMMNGFKIFPTLSVFYYSGMQVDEFKDNALRESLINATWTFAMDMSHRFSPVGHGTQLTKHTVVGQDAHDIEILSFSDILSNINNFSGLRLSFGAANLFRTFSNAIYPYLEYQFTFPQAVADRFYTIEWRGRAGEYDVKILLKKPTVQGTVGGDFTVIF